MFQTVPDRFWAQQISFHGSFIRQSQNHLNFDLVAVLHVSSVTVWVFNWNWVLLATLNKMNILKDLLQCRRHNLCSHRMPTTKKPHHRGLRKEGKDSRGQQNVLLTLYLDRNKWMSDIGQNYNPLCRHYVYKNVFCVVFGHHHDGIYTYTPLLTLEEHLQPLFTVCTEPRSETYRVGSERRKNTKLCTSVNIHQALFVSKYRYKWLCWMYGDVNMLCK